MLKATMTGIVMAALAYAQTGYAADNAMPSKESADRQTTTNQFWWPERLDLAPLRQHAAESDPASSGNRGVCCHTRCWPALAVNRASNLRNETNK